jgi:hypothetical protein
MRSGLKDSEDDVISSLITLSGNVRVCPITGVVLLGVLGSLSLEILRHDPGLVGRASKVLPRRNRKSR